MRKLGIAPKIKDLNDNIPAVNDWMETINTLAKVCSQSPLVYVNNSSTQSITSGSVTKVKLDAEVYDTSNNFDTTLYRFTPKIAAYYQIYGQVTLDCTSLAPPIGTSLVIGIYQNGVLKAQNRIGVFNAASYFAVNISVPLLLNGSTDYIEMFVTQGTGSSYNLLTGSQYTYMSATLIRST